MAYEGDGMYGTWGTVPPPVIDTIPDTFFAKHDVRGRVRTLLTTVPVAKNVKADLHQWAMRTLRRPFEPDFRALPDLLPADAVCVDLGANRGQSIDALQLLIPGCRIVAYEPQRALARRLHHRHRNGRVIIRSVGVADTPAEHTIHIPHYNGCRFDGAATMIEAEALQWLEWSIRGYDPAKAWAEQEQCQVVRLDDEGHHRVDLIKADIQGFELSALRGATRILERDHPVILVEQGHTNDIDPFLARFGYRPYSYQAYPWLARRLTKVGGSLVPGFGPLNTIYLPVGRDYNGNNPRGWAEDGRPR